MSPTLTFIAYKYSEATYFYKGMSTEYIPIREII